MDPIDEIAIQNLKSFKDKNFVDISKEDLDLGMKTLSSNFDGFILFVPIVQANIYSLLVL